MYRFGFAVTLITLTVLLLSACQPLQTPDTSVQLPEETVAAMQEIVEATMAKNQIPGIALAVVQDGEMVYAQGFGLLDIEGDQPVTPETVFQLASTSKPITAMAIMQLAEAGKLKLDAPLIDYLPYFEMADDHYSEITIEQILTHRSGIPEGGGFLGQEIVPEFDDEAAERYVRSLADLELLFAPGEDWSYSDMGYNVLGDVIAKVSDQSFEEYTQQHIFDPLGMKQTTFLLSDVQTATLALPHMLDASGQMAVVDVLPYTRPFAPSDTLYSNVADMSRLAKASFNHGELEGERVLDEESWKQMWTVRTPTWFGDFLDNIAPDYAYGWYWGEVANHPVVHHVGTDTGYQNIFLLAPEDDLAVIAMGNGLAPDEDFFYAVGVGQDVMKVLLNTETAETSVADLPIPRLEPIDCKYPVLEGANAECSYLVVPEDRTDPDSPTIRVLVVKFLSASEEPQPDPLIMIPGGPGAPGPTWSWFVAALPVGEAIRADRDVYLLETRGAMSSEPAFYCPETEVDVAELVDMTMAEEVAWTEDAYRACHDRLVEEGANFSHYGFLDIAGDVVDLRTALGVDEINVYGVSYGTTPAMMLMRDQPEGIRSVILDSVIPPDVTYLETVLGNLTMSVENMFAACQADPACDAVYPDLATVFADVLAQLREEPVTVTVTDDAGQEHAVIVDDVKFAHFVYDSIFIGDGFTMLPAAIYAANEGDLEAPAATWLGYVGGQHAPVSAENGSWAKGMTYSAMCLQEGSTTDLAKATAVYDGVDTLPSLRDWGVTHMLGEWLAPCEYWAVTRPEPNTAIEPVESDLPTLMLGGLFDPEAPPRISQAAVERLSRSFDYELPAAHGLLFMDCAVDLMAQFLADPTQEPDAACIAEMTPAWVLPE